MHPISWMLLFILALAVAYGSICAYRLAWTTVSDAVLLIALTVAALGAGWLFG